MEYLVNDLQNIKAKCASQQEYQNEGKKWMKSAKITHSMQNNYAYSNAIQQQMVCEQKSKKSKYWIDFFNPCFAINFFFWEINN